MIYVILLECFLATSFGELELDRLLGMILRIRNEIVDMKNCTLKSSYVVSTKCCLGVLIETYYVFI